MGVPLPCSVASTLAVRQHFYSVLYSEAAVYLLYALPGCPPVGGVILPSLPQGAAAPEMLVSTDKTICKREAK